MHNAATTRTLRANRASWIMRGGEQPSDLKPNRRGRCAARRAGTLRAAPKHNEKKRWSRHGSSAGTIGKIVAWFFAVLAVLIAVLVIVFLTFDWNRARPWVDDKVSQAIGRQFHITGDLKVGWQRPPSETGWKRWVPWPRFSAQKITVANPDWAKQPYFATLDEIDFQVARAAAARARHRDSDASTS